MGRGVGFPARWEPCRRRAHCGSQHTICVSLQVTFKIFEAAEMKPLLEFANAEKEKDADAAR